MSRWRWRGSVALLAVALAFFIYPLLPNDDVINSDWPAFATGARLIVSDPGHLYDLAAQQRAESDVTGGRVLVTVGIHGILPFLAPAWVALLAVPFDALGTDLGGRLWILAGLVCLAFGLYLATRPRPPNAILAAFAGVPLGLTLMNPQLVLPLGVALLLARRWKVLAGWAAAGLVLLLPTLFLDPHWVTDWLAQARTTVAPVSREVDVAHLGVLLPGPAVAVLVVLAVALMVYLAWRRRED